LNNRSEPEAAQGDGRFRIDRLEEWIAPCSADFPPGRFPWGNPAHAPGKSNPNTKVVVEAALSDGAAGAAEGRVRLLMTPYLHGMLREIVERGFRRAGDVAHAAVGRFGGPEAEHAVLHVMSECLVELDAAAEPFALPERTR
jgi:hypothetical protein